MQTASFQEQQWPAHTLTRPYVLRVLPRRPRDCSLLGSETGSPGIVPAHVRSRA